MLLLKLENYIPWFKEMLIPFDEEGIMIFGGEASDCSSSNSEENESY